MNVRLASDGDRLRDTHDHRKQVNAGSFVRFGPMVVLALLFSLVPCWYTGALSHDWLAEVPSGQAHCATVPLLNTWSIWWNAVSLRRGFSGYWDAPIFFPSESAFAFSEPQPATLLLTPAVAAGVPLVWLYNASLWLHLFLNGVVTAIAVRRRQASWIVAAVCGLLMQLLPLVHSNIDASQLTAVWTLVWTLSALEVWGRQLTIGRSAEVVLAVTITFAVCVHQAFLAVVVILSPCAVLIYRWNRKLIFLATATVLGLLLTTGSWLLPMQQALKAGEFKRGDELVARLSALPGDYIRPTQHAWWTVGDDGDRSMFALCPGWIHLLAGGLSLVAIRRPNWRWIAFLWATSILAYLFSLGPQWAIGEWRPWNLLVDHVSGFAQIRNVFRFGFLVQICCVLLIAETLTRLPHWRPTGGKSISSALAAILAVACLLETVPPRGVWSGVPTVKPSDWSDTVHQKLTTGRGVICLPMPTGLTVEELEADARWMLLGTLHGRPLANGYSGFFPPLWYDLRKASQDFPAVRFLDQLRDISIEMVVVQREAYPTLQANDKELERLGLELLHEGAGGIDVYRLSGPRTQQSDDGDPASESNQ